MHDSHAKSQNSTRHNVPSIATIKSTSKKKHRIAKLTINSKICLLNMIIIWLY